MSNPKSKIQIFIILILLSITTEEPVIKNQIFYRKTNYTLLPSQITLSQYLSIGYCQSITNKCESIPIYPYPRAFHTSIIYSTYSQSESNEMCPDDSCGPFCNYTDDSCNLNITYQGYPLPDVSLRNYNFKGPNDTNCPDSML